MCGSIVCFVYVCRHIPGARWDPVTPFGGGGVMPGRGGRGRGGRHHGYANSMPANIF